MPFRPVLNDQQHAVVETVFQIGLDRVLTAGEIQSLIDAHPRWQDDLPRQNRLTAFEFSPANPGAAPLQHEGARGVNFEAIKKDGTLDWRLQAEGNAITVNCLSYSNWAEVWARAKSYLQQAYEIVLGDGKAIRQCVLQYVDVFRWSDDVAQYELSALLNQRSKYLAPKIFGAGPLWHLHQGWFRNIDSPQAGRVLERINLDGVQVESAHYNVNIDAYLRLELKEPISNWDRSVSGSDDIDVIYDWLHLNSKKLVADCLNDEVGNRIGLHG